MASTAPILPFLRPLRLPRPSTIQHFLRFSTSIRCSQLQPPFKQNQKPKPKPQHTRRPREDPNLTASRTASPTYPPPSLPSLPRPKIARASRRTSNPPTKLRPYPTRRPSHHQPTTPTLLPQPVTLLSPDLSAPNLAYFVSRTKSNELPVYELRKRGGNLKLTRVRKVDGDLEVLRDGLRDALGLEAKGEVVVNGVAGQVVVRGHWRQEVVRFLRERRF